MFGKSVFQSVLDRLKSEDEDEPAAENRPASGIRGLASGFVAASDHAGVAGADIHRAYADFAGDIPAPPVVEPHAWLKRILPEDIAEDLGLTGAETVHELGVIRRAFAIANHPDRYPADRRADATRRMTIANMLIDAAIRRQALRRKH